MRLKAVLLPVVAFIMFLAPLGVQAASTSFFGPIFPANCECPGRAPDWGCVLQFVQNIIEFAVSFGVLVSVLFIAYAGFLWMMSPLHAANRQKGRTIMLNAFIGLVVVLAGWLIVDFVLKHLYNESASGPGVAQLGPWNEILNENSGALCIDVNTEQGDIWEGGGTTPDPIDVPAGEGIPDPSADGNLRFQDSIGNQLNHASPALVTFIECMADRIPSNTGYISGISDSTIISGEHTWPYCRANGQGGGCKHGANSCHYGGTSCGDRSFAVDYGDGGADNVPVSQILEQHARACNSQVFVNREGNHVHFSLGAANNCGCN